MKKTIDLKDQGQKWAAIEDKGDRDNNNNFLNSDDYLKSKKNSKAKKEKKVKRQ